MNMNDLKDYEMRIIIAVAVLALVFSLTMVFLES